MPYLNILIKIVIALSIMNVWLLRYNKPSPYRGGSATTIKEEFAAYGLPESVMKVVGTLKVLFSILLLISIFYRRIEDFPAAGIAVLMLGAIGMHLKIGDPIMKSMPAFVFFVLSLVVIWT